MVKGLAQEPEAVSHCVARPGAQGLAWSGPEGCPSVAMWKQGCSSRRAAHSASLLRLGGVGCPIRLQAAARETQSFQNEGSEHSLRHHQQAFEPQVGSELGDTISPTKRPPGQIIKVGIRGSLGSSAI